MKNIYIIQNSNLSFDMDISKIFSPHEYSLFLITNQFGKQKITDKDYEQYIHEIWVTENFNLENLSKIITDTQIKYPHTLEIVTNAEEAVKVCGNLNIYFKLKSENYDRFINKVLMKELVSKNHILTPKYIVFNKDECKNNQEHYVSSICNKLSFPIIVKPIDSMSCMNIKKITTKENLGHLCDSLMISDGLYEIDEYIEGKIYNLDSYIKNGKILFTQVSETSNSCYDFICGKIKGTIALPPNNEKSRLLSEYAITAHNSLGIPEGGVTHLEVILTENGNIFFVEIAHRSPGILIPEMYRKYLNVNTIESHILLQISDSYKLEIKYGPYTAWIAFPTKNGILTKKHTPNISSEHTLEWGKNVGDIMLNASTGRDFAGKLLLWNSDYEQLRKDFYYLSSFNFYDVKSAHQVI